mmetsp:Transcript_22366/g.31180  ORF Transcript_22366/g.31180 Transcript_22366/m.31180 type:complete len:822 (-) Transcript_22366:53-2518(-)
MLDVSSRVQPRRTEPVAEFSRDTMIFDKEAVKKQLQEEELKHKESTSTPQNGTADKSPNTTPTPAPKTSITTTQPAQEESAQPRRRSNTLDTLSPPVVKTGIFYRSPSATTSSPSSSPRGTVSPKGTTRGNETPKSTARRDWQSMSAFDQTKHLQEMATEATIRICMIGLDCGKSSLIRRFLNQEFVENYDPSVEDNHSVTVSFDGTGNTNYKLDIIDCGSTFYNAFKDKWLQNADSFIIVYSVTNRLSFDTVSMFIDDIIKTKNNKLVPILLCGNKVDLMKNRAVSTSEGRQLSEHYRCGFMEVSASSGHNVNQMFQYITDTVVRLRTLSISEQQLDVASLYTGWVQKRKKGNFWKKRYIIVTTNAIRYFHKVPNNMNDNSSIKGLIPLKGLVVTCDKHEAESLLRSRMPKKGSPATSGTGTISKGGSMDGKNMFLLTNQNVLYELKLAATDQRNALIRVIQDVIDQQTSEQKKHTPATEPAKQAETDTTEVSALDKDALVKKVSQMFNNQSADNAIKLFVSWHQQNEKEISILEAVAGFLLCEGLSKRKIGEFLGHPDNVEVLHKFMSQVNFANLKFDAGLRQVLQLFLLPGEAQKIDRIMEVFATHYCKQNPTAFDNPDTAYVLAFSLIMLNTDAHNKAIPPEKKMTKQQFVRNNKGINQGKDLPEAYLSDLYDSIVSNEISMDYQRDDIVQWDLQGSVLLQAVGKALKKPSPKKKWCIVSGNCLYAFNAPQDASPYLIVPLQSNMICDIDHQTRFIKLTSFQSLIKAAKKSKSKTYTEILISPEDGKLLRWVLALTNTQTVKRQTMAADAPPALQTS